MLLLDKFSGRRLLSGDIPNDSQRTEQIEKMEISYLQEGWK